MPQRWIRALCALAVVCPCAVQAQHAEERAFMNELSDPMGLPQPAPRAMSDGDANGRLGSQRMRAANRVASGILRRRMAASRASELALLDDARDAEVIVIRGEHDRVQDVLRAIGIRHVVLPPYLLSRLPVMSTQTIMLNCPGELSARAQRTVRRAVETGAFLVTTDWALSTVARMFPRTIRPTGAQTADDVVSVHVHEEGEHAFLQHVAREGDRPRWWLEGASYPIRIVDPARVRVLIESDQMRRRYGSGPIAVTFDAGEGAVLHTTSHFFLQQARLVGTRERSRGSRFAEDVGLGQADVDALRAEGADDVAVGEVLAAYSIQQLLANVVVEKRRQNVRLLREFSLRATRAVALRESAEADAAEVARLEADFRLRPLGVSEGAMIRVRDLFGREGFVERAAVQSVSAPGRTS